MARTDRFVRAEPGRVFEVLADGWRYSAWVVGTGSVRAVDPTWPAVGSRLHHTAPWPFAVGDETKVEASESDRGLVLLARGRPLGEARVEIELRPERDGTRVVLVEHPVSGPGSWAHNPVFDAILRRRNVESLGRLAALVERPVEP